MRASLLDRRGKLHYYTEDSNPISEHYEIAKRLNSKSKDPMYSLVRLGWVVLGSRFVSNYSGKKPTQSQINTLFDLGIRYVQDFYSKTGKQWQVY